MENENGMLQQIKLLLQEELRPIRQDIQALKQGQELLVQEQAGLKQGQELLMQEQVGLKQGQELLMQEQAGLKQGQELLMQEQVGLKQGQELLMQEQVGLKQGQELLMQEQVGLKQGQELLAIELQAVKAKVIDIDDKLLRLSIDVENDIKPKITTLFDADKQRKEQLDRIESQVSRHDEYIFKRLK